MRCAPRSSPRPTPSPKASASRSSSRTSAVVRPTTARRARVRRCASSRSWARSILAAPPARRAYRRPVTDEDMSVVMAFYADGRSKSDFDGGVELALQRILVSPSFLFRTEFAPEVAANGSYRISDLALASRLSFFLWSSIPDDELLDLAIANKLKEPAVLERQVRRMLVDSRSESLVNNFASQWL